ncbi:DNA primase [Candidatus Haliotispira prima]|uniref:DNA primase n=1 Tax=Candidatus Haliotispira prima TaxID=3034016 RepID=A0ABY8MGZ6_9SPIO|nr:DNA primase [Candidatus Haliotispira prima]
MSLRHYPKEVIDQLLDRVDMVSLAQKYVERLENRGGRWWGCCPFHMEKTASFTINPERKSYYCFGCQEKGNAISLVMRQESLNFPEALQKLAQRTGFELPQKNESGPQAAVRKAEHKKREALFSLYMQVHKGFRQNLRSPRGRIARDYLEQRGFNAETTEHFELGYAVDEGKAVYHWLRHQNYSEEILRESGLFSRRSEEFCLFRQRLIFPVFDAEGRVIAFSGRQLVSNAGLANPKYINSRESLAYRKGESLFGLYQSLKSLRRERCLVLCEGNLDVLAWHQAGIGHAAAPLGTAFTPEQAKLLKRYCDKVILAFDGDEAGQKAIYKAAFLLEEEGLGSRVIPLAAGRDPADILQHEGVADLKSLMQSPLDFFNFLARDLDERFALDELNGVSSALRFLAPFMIRMKGGLRRELYIAQFAKLFGLKQEVLAAEPSWHYMPRYYGGSAPTVPDTGGQNKAKEMGDTREIMDSGKAGDSSRTASGKPGAGGKIYSSAKAYGERVAKSSTNRDLSSDFCAELAEREFWASMLLQADLYPEWQESLSQYHWESREAALFKALLDQACREQDFNFETLCDRVSRRWPELGQWLLQKRLEPLQESSAKDAEDYDMASYRWVILQQKYCGLQDSRLRQRRDKALQQIQVLEKQGSGPELQLELLREIQGLDGELIQLRETMQQLQKKIQRSSKSYNSPILENSQ